MSTTYPQYPLTIFPEGIDNFNVFMDVVQSDYELLKLYQSALEDGDMAKAQNILEQIPNGSRKIISALRLNQLREAILALENFYGRDFVNYITNKQREWTDTIDRFIYKGVFNSALQYVRNNIVSYTNPTTGLNQLYINTYVGSGQTPVGTLPTNTNYWRLLTIQGQQGISGDEGNFDFDWQSSKEYQPNTIVVYNNAWWRAIVPNVNTNPASNPNIWEKVLEIAQAIYPVQKPQPVLQKTGELWFKVL